MVKSPKSYILLITAFLILAVSSALETHARDIMQLQRYTVSDGLSHNIINSIIEDSNGDIWIATWNGLCRWHDNTITAYIETKDHQRLGRISYMWESADGSIVYQSGTGKLFSFDYNTGERSEKHVNRMPSMKRNFPYKWGEDEQGLFICRNQITYHVPFDENNKTESRSRAFFQDSKARLWFNFNSSLYMATFAPSPFFHFTSSPNSDIPFNATVKSIFCNSRGDLLFGTRSAQLHGLTEQPLGFNDDPYSITEDRTGRLWVAMRNTGVNIISNPYSDSKNEILILEGIPVFSLLNKSDANEIWAGTWGKGIHIFKEDKNIPIENDKILNNAYVHSMCRCSNGNIAVCTKNGLHIVSQDKNVLYSTDTTLDVISAIETKYGDVLFSTMGQGLYRLSFPKTGKSPVIHEEKLPYDDVVLDMLYDSEEYLWIIADTRLFRFKSLSDMPEIFDSKDFGKDLTFIESASCLYRDSLLYLGVTPGVLEINLNELNRYVQSRALRLSKEQLQTRQRKVMVFVAISFCAVLILLLFLRKRKNKRNKIEIALRKPISQDGDKEFIDKLTLTLQQFIEDSDVDMEQVARSLGMTRNAFYQRCREVMHSTPAALLQDMRIERACQLMQAGEQRVKEVTWKSGFTDAKYFTKVFKSKKGVTPTEYIAKNCPN